MSPKVSVFPKINVALVNADRRSRALDIFKQGLRKFVFVKVDF